MPRKTAKKPISHARESAAAAEWVSLDTLQAWKRNPRKHGETVRKLVRAIVRYGWGSPIEARAENSEVIAGHGRMMAAARLQSKWKRASVKARSRWHPEARRIAESGEVPVRYRELDEDDAHAAAIADNRIGQESEWDDDLLAENLEELEDEADLMGFDDAELDKMLGDCEREMSAPEHTDVTPLIGESFRVTVSGPLQVQPQVLDELNRVAALVPGVAVTADA